MSKKLEEKYKELKEMEDPDDGIVAFKHLLLESDDDEVLDFHIEILKDKEDKYLHEDIFTFFSARKDKNKTGNYLFEKICSDDVAPAFKAELLQILGQLKHEKTLEAAKKYCQSDNETLRHRCIVIMGWLGGELELLLLNDRLLNDESGQLRGYAAASMRQIYLDHPETKVTVIQYLKDAILKENDEQAIRGLVLAIQDILAKDLGMKESVADDISGDIELAKGKTIESLAMLEMLDGMKDGMKNDLEKKTSNGVQHGTVDPSSN